MTYQNHTALLIDAENTSISKLTSYLETARPFDREITLKRAYGNWSNPCLKNWEPLLRAHAVHPVQLFACAAGKNAADIALAVDAVELLHTGQYDTFIIMSSDSDYTPLVVKLREAGVRVLGIGKEDAPEAYRSACTNYLCLHNIYSEAPDSLQALPKKRGFRDEEDAPAKSCGLIEDNFLDTAFLFDGNETPGEEEIIEEGADPFSELDELPILEDEPDFSVSPADKENIWDALFGKDEKAEAETGEIVWDTLDDAFCFSKSPAKDTPGMRGVHKLLRIAYDSCKGENGYATLASIGSFIKEVRPEFDCRDYGFKQLHALLLAYPEQYQVISYPAKARAKVMAFRCRA